MEYLNWDTLEKTFYLMDTFNGIDKKYLTDEEKKYSIKRNDKDIFYERKVYFSEVQQNFSQWKNIKMILGPIPETLNIINVKKIAYLHIDMNCVIPEVAAFNFFWEHLVLGAFVLFDDYAYKGYELQKNAMDQAAEKKGLKIVSLPTGQGLLVKTV